MHLLCATSLISDLSQIGGYEEERTEGRKGQGVQTPENFVLIGTWMFLHHRHLGEK